MDPNNPSNPNSPFQTPGYIPVMDPPLTPNNPNSPFPSTGSNPNSPYVMDQPLWSPQMSFAQYNQSPNAFQQLHQMQPLQQQYQQMQQFQHMQQMQQLHRFQQSQPVAVDDTQDDVDEVEVVLETQPEKAKTKKTKKRTQKEVVEPSGKAQSISWSGNEEAALARAWVIISEDARIGNAQTGAGFWGRVTDKFHELMQKDPYRLVHSVSSKFRDLNKKVSWFCGYYNNAYINRPSGASDADVLKTAFAKFQSKHGMAFSHVGAWEVLHKCSKWAPVPNEIVLAKRSKHLNLTNTVRVIRMHAAILT